MYSKDVNISQVSFTIYGIPPSVNHYWGIHGHRRFITPEGQQYKRDFGYQCPRMPNGEKIKVPVELWITWTRPDNRRRDWDNILKVLGDSLQEYLLEDDNLIVIAHVDKTPKPDKKNPHITIAINLL